MKKVIAIITLIAIIAVAFTGCTFKRPTAVLSGYSKNGVSGSAYALDSIKAAVASPVRIDAKNGETIHLKYWCPTCGYLKEVDVEAPFSDVWVCDCELTKMNDGVPGYVNILIYEFPSEAED